MKLFITISKRTMVSLEYPCVGGTLFLPVLQQILRLLVGVSGFVWAADGNSFNLDL